MTSSDLLLSNSLSLSEQVRDRTNQLRCKIVRANYKSKFAQTVPELTEFRRATADPLVVEEMDDNIVSDTFRNTVQFTTYDSYAPYIEKFFETPCRAGSIVDLLAPGLPDFLAESSSTSGGLTKTFPRYNCMEKIRTADRGSSTVFDPRRRRTRAQICWRAFDRVEVLDDINRPIKTIYSSCGTGVIERVNWSLDPEEDEGRMAKLLFDHAAPYAAGFIKDWRAFLFVHAFFAITSRSLETMKMAFITTFVDMIRHLDTEFDMMVNCIANGTIPDLEGIAEVRHYLELNISPNPERAEELRQFGRPSCLPGWCGRVWPNLRSITGIASGPFALSVPLAKWFLGPNTALHALGYASTEAWIGLPYNPLELNQYKLSSQTLIEFLDVSKGDSINSLAQPWEVESGRRYEIVVTTQDGLWRYRLGDVVEILGFDPTDGTPIIQFIERRNVAIRFPDFVVTEKELRAAVSSLGPTLPTKVVNWTTTIDDRSVPATIGFFIEFADNQPPASNLAPVSGYVLGELSRSNNNIAWAITQGLCGQPTIRLVRRGTFTDFLQLKYDEDKSNLGQVKVPVVLPKAAYVEWFEDRVIQEL